MYNKESDTYPDLINELTRQGYYAKRIEGVPTFPDIIAFRNGSFIVIEVKLYKGEKDMTKGYFTYRDLTWQPGQRVYFPSMMKKVGCLNNYYVYVYNKKGDLRIFKGDKLW